MLNLASEGLREQGGYLIPPRHTIVPERIEVVAHEGTFLAIIAFTFRGLRCEYACRFGHVDSAGRAHIAFVNRYELLLRFPDGILLEYDDYYSDDDGAEPPAHLKFTHCRFKPTIQMQHHYDVACSSLASQLYGIVLPLARAKAHA